MSAVPSNVVAYSISSLLLYCQLECKEFVSGPGMSAVPSNGMVIGSPVYCCEVTLSVRFRIVSWYN